MFITTSIKEFNPVFLLVRFAFFYTQGKEFYGAFCLAFAQEIFPDLIPKK